MMNDNRNKTHSGLLCVSIGMEGVEESVAAAKEVAGIADVVEIRLDTLKQPEVTSFIRNIETPLLLTCRPEWEGGFFTGGEEERIDLLVQAVQNGATYVDLELQAPEESYKKLLPVLHGSETRLIVSHHYFQSTPESADLSAVVRAMKESGADIGKIVTTANDHLDVLRVLQLPKEANEMDFPLIAFCMGKAGIISRLATIELGGYMTYCARNEEESTAPGQIPVQTMRRVLQELGLAGYQSSWGMLL